MLAATKHRTQRSAGCLAAHESGRIPVGCVRGDTKERWMSEYSSLSDDFYINVNLSTEMDLPYQRESLLHFFEQVQKRFPRLQNFHCRERQEFVLEEDKDQGTYRWVSVEQRRVNSGFVNPSTHEEAMQQHRTVLELAPFALSASPLDCESLSLTYGFDFTYAGNQNALITEALGVVPAFERLLELPECQVLCNEPSIQIALDDECRTQARVHFETRTTAFHVRSGEYPEEQLSVFLTVRRYDSLSPDETFAGELDRLAGVGKELVDSFLIENILRPLQRTIALQ
jgi:hypothetical protein